MTVGWVLAALGLIAVAFPRPIAAAAKGWRIGMPDTQTEGAVRAARIGAVAVTAAGLVIALA